VEFVEFVEFIGCQWGYGGDTVERLGIGDWRLEAVRMMLRDRQPSQ
jgi:hypothetical protein